MAGRVLAAVVVVAGCMAAAQAQVYPARTVRIVVPYPPGGGNDLLGRPIAQKLADKWGQSVIIDNRAGASGMIGAEAVAKSAPDGYTLLLCASPECALNVTLYPKMAYSPTRDFVPVTQLAVSSLVLVVHPSLPAGNVRAYLALARLQAGELAYSTVGAGSPHHMAGEWLKLLAGVKINHVPYKGGGPQLIDLMGGQVHSGFVALPVLAPYAKSGKVRLLAVTTARRSPSIPDVPTLVESGLAGFDVSQWYGVVAPAGTPANISARLNADLLELLHLRDMRSRMADLGAEPVGSSQVQFGEFMRAEIAKYLKLVAATGITLE